MKYKPKQYAEALFDALSGAKEGEEHALIGNFATTVRKNKDWARLPLIVKQFEKIYREKHGLTKLEVESAHPLTEKTKEELEKAVGKKVLFEEKVNPKLLAGLRILIDDSTFIDASALRHINNLFVNAN